MSLFDETCDFFTDPIRICVGCLVIPSHNFQTLVETLIDNNLITVTTEEGIQILTTTSLRFSACGANHSEKYGVLRKNKKTGWKYIEEALKKA
jgi:hypothetical protein